MKTPKANNVLLPFLLCCYSLAACYLYFCNV